MNTQIQIFNNSQFGEVRVTEIGGEALFCLVDVARALGYSNPAKAVIDHCKGVSILETPTAGGVQQMKYGEESEVYRLIFSSTLPDAEKFKAWVCKEVLPAIRKHGGYDTIQNIKSNIAA
jgi:anti-repressor protein